VVVVKAMRPAEHLVAVVVPRGDSVPSIVELKRFSAERLPRHMIVGASRSTPSLPRTSTGKIDRAAVVAWLDSGEGHVP